MSEEMSLDEYKKLLEKGVQKSKYRNKKVEYDGIMFDSIRERNDYIELKDREQKGEVRNIRLQPKFTLLNGFRDMDGKKHQEITYIADFRYFDVALRCDVVKDSKGYRTKVFRIKEKLFRSRYPHIKFIVG